jgi:hypothetical protein
LGENIETIITKVITTITRYVGISTTFQEYPRTNLRISKTKVGTDVTANPPTNKKPIMVKNVNNNLKKIFIKQYY